MRVWAYPDEAVRTEDSQCGGEGRGAAEERGEGEGGWQQTVGKGRMGGWAGGKPADVISML